MAKKEVNFNLIKQAVTARLANKRQSPADTKTRGEVAGGGAKPWRQKGTGRARAGSRRSPIWVGGGITFGPRSTINHSQRLPKKMALKAFGELIELKKSQKLYQEVESLHLKEPRTKAALAMLAKAGIALNQKLILVTEKIEPELRLAVNNLPNVETFEATYFAIDNLIDRSLIVIEKPAVKVINQRLGAKSTPVTPAKKVLKPIAAIKVESKIVEKKKEMAKKIVKSAVVKANKPVKKVTKEKTK